VYDQGVLKLGTASGDRVCPHKTGLPGATGADSLLVVVP